MSSLLDRSGATGLGGRTKRLVVAAVGLAVVVALAFWLVGAMRDADGALTSPLDAGGAGDEAADAASEVGGSSGAGGPGEAPAGRDRTPEAEAAVPPAGAIDPSTISVQVLDAVFDPSAVTAAGMMEEARADGYDVIVLRTAARQYRTTTVFFTPGHRAEARQFARAYDIRRVAPKPDNLSDEVDVHLVVGTDRRS